MNEFTFTTLSYNKSYKEGKLIEKKPVESIMTLRAQEKIYVASYMIDGDRLFLIPTGCFGVFPALQGGFNQAMAYGIAADRQMRDIQKRIQEEEDVIREGSKKTGEFIDSFLSTEIQILVLADRLRNRLDWEDDVFSSHHTDHSCVAVGGAGGEMR